VRTVPVDESRVQVVYNGVDQGFLDTTFDPADEVAGPGPHVGIFGVIEPRKGHHVFLRAAARLAQAYPTAHFWVIGPVALADKAALPEGAGGAGRHPRAAGPRDLHGLPCRMWRGGCRPWTWSLLPSVAHESLGMVLVEAMTLGKAVVGSNLGGPAEVIRDGETGRLVPPDDPAALADAIGWFLAEDRTEIRARAAVDARERFSPQVFAERVASVYEGMLQQKVR
jgi:glycosyltransferase involved in cell wall biosynthesis